MAGAIAQGIAEAIEMPDRGLQKGATLRRFLIEPANIPDDRFRTSRTMVQHRLTAGAHRSGLFYFADLRLLRVRRDSSSGS